MTKTIKRPSSWTIISVAPRSSAWKNMFFAVVLFFGIGTTAYTQTLIQWQKHLGGSGDDRAYSIQQTTDGGYVVAGSIQVQTTVMYLVIMEVLITG